MFVKFITDTDNWWLGNWLLFEFFFSEPLKLCSLATSASKYSSQEFSESSQFYRPDSNKKFSSIGQNFELAKFRGIAGLIGLTEYKSELQRRIMSGPEIAHIVDEFECSDHGTDSVQEYHDPLLPWMFENICLRELSNLYYSMIQ